MGRGARTSADPARPPNRPLSPSVSAAPLGLISAQTLTRTMGRGHRPRFAHDTRPTIFHPLPSALRIAAECQYRLWPYCVPPATTNSNPLQADG